MIHIPTAALIALLTDLAKTAASPDTGNAMAGVLLHTAKGYADPESPGKSDILAATSSNGQAAAHAYTSCTGQLHDPMLWHISNVTGMIAVLRPLVARDQDHKTVIRVEAGHVVVTEDENLFDSGDRHEFKSGSLDDYPRTLWDWIAFVPGVDGNKGTPQGRMNPRTDYNPTTLEPFLAIAKRRKAMLELYHYEDKRLTLVQVGDRYRGVLSPFPFEGHDVVGSSTARAPGGEVYRPVLPPVPVKPPVAALAKDSGKEPELPLEPDPVGGA